MGREGTLEGDMPQGNGCDSRVPTAASDANPVAEGCVSSPVGGKNAKRIA